MSKDAGYKIVAHMMPGAFPPLCSPSFSPPLSPSEQPGLALTFAFFAPPDLPNVGVERDMAQFKEFFENPAYRTDGLKLYPTLVIRGTGLYELWKTGQYKNYTPNALVDIVARIMALVPPWTRVYRVQRDIPMPLVSSGVENGNLRELALGRVKDFGAECRDVRYREVGVRFLSPRLLLLVSCAVSLLLLAPSSSCRSKRSTTRFDRTTST